MEEQVGNFIKSYDGSQLEKIRVSWTPDKKGDQNEAFRNKVAEAYLLNTDITNKSLIRDLFKEHVKLSEKIWDPHLDGGQLAKRLLEETGTEYLEIFLRGLENYDLWHRVNQDDFTLDKELIKKCITQLKIWQKQGDKTEKLNSIEQGLELFVELLEE